MDDTTIQPEESLAVQDIPEVIDTSNSTNQLGRKSIPEVLLEERRQYTLGLQMSGIAYPTIVKELNSRNRIKGWGEVSLQMVSRDIAAYYRQNQVTDLEDYDHLDNLRTAMVYQVEKIIEKMSLHVYDKNYKWKPFEYMTALAELHRAQNNLMEMQNWHLGNKNPTSVHLETNHITQIFDKAAMDLLSTPKPVIQELNDLFDASLNKLNDDPDITVTNSINDV